jgi:acetolactate synthase-1/2/3 large subunit
MNASELIVRCLENEGVRYIFGVPGEENLDFMEALSQSDQITFVTTRHEQGAAFMANVYGRLSTYPGVCLATLGPGATNLVTGIADAFLDRAPLVAITGQGARGSGFKESHQYLDIVRLLEPVTRWNTRIEQAAAVPEIVRKAFRLARLEKPSATHIELPEDVATEPVEGVPLPVRRTTYPQALPDSVERTISLLHAAERPIVLAGNGVIRRQAAGSRAADCLATFVRQLGLPVVPTFMGKGGISSRETLAQPAMGLRTPVSADSPLAEADLVLAIGYDLVEWAPRFWNGTREKTIVHIDSTAAEIDSHYLPAVEVVGEIGASLRALAAGCDFRAPQWLDDGARRAALQVLEQHRHDTSFPCKPQRVLADLRTALQDDDILIADVGVHKLWVATLFPTVRANSVIIANGLASMGIAVPGALAAKLVHPERKVVAVTGDGGFLMNSQELETAKRLGTAFVTVVWTDNRYGVIALNQERRFGRAFASTFSNPDLVKYAEAFGLPGFRVEHPGELLPTLQRALACAGPSVVEVPIDPEAHRELGHLQRAMLPEPGQLHTPRSLPAGAAPSLVPATLP